MRSERLEECTAVGAAEVVALTATAVVQDLVTAVGVGDRLEPRGDLGNRGVPVDFLEGPVRPAPHRRGQATAIVLVVVQAQCLVAGVPTRRGVVLVAADAGQGAVLDLHHDAAVAFTQKARDSEPPFRSVCMSHYIVSGRR